MIEDTEKFIHAIRCWVGVHNYPTPYRTHSKKEIKICHRCGHVHVLH